jgi:uncharacterized integral membrane protein
MKRRHIIIIIIIVRVMFLVLGMLVVLVVLVTAAMLSFFPWRRRWRWRSVLPLGTQRQLDLRVTEE